MKWIMLSSISDHYLNRLNLVYLICFNLSSNGIDYAKWIKYYNYYQDMLFFHGLPGKENNVIGIW